MPEPAKKPNPWPFLAIVVLVGLLSAFVILKFARNERTPIVKPGADNSENAPDPEAERKKKFDALWTEALKAFEDKRYEDAEKALWAARELMPGKENKDLDKMASQIRDARKSQEDSLKSDSAKVLGEIKKDWGYPEILQYLEEARRKNPGLDASPDFWNYYTNHIRSKVIAEVNKLARDDQSQEALELLDRAAEQHSWLKHDDEFQRCRKKIAGYVDDADRARKKSMSDARAALKGGRFYEALKLLKRARLICTWKSAELEPLESEIMEAWAAAEMVRIPPGKAMLGTEGKEEEYQTKGYLIDRHHVTNEAYEVFVFCTEHAPPLTWLNRMYPKGHEKHPVVCITYADAEAFAKWAHRRMPTAEEWELAARWIDKRPYPWGFDWDEKSEHAYKANCQEYWQVHRDRSPSTTPVDWFVPKDPRDPKQANGVSPYGVWDMAGNAWQWTASRVEVAQGDRKTAMHVLKGGSFMTTKEALRSSNRLLEEPELAGPDVGFRCAKD